MATAAIDKINKPHDLPKVKQAPVNWGGGLMVIPHPKEVLNIMKSIPYGRTLTLDEIRAKLAKDHNSDIACPMTTGIFVSLAAQAYEEGSVHRIHRGFQSTVGCRAEPIGGANQALASG